MGSVFKLEYDFPSPNSSHVILGACAFSWRLIQNPIWNDPLSCPFQSKSCWGFKLVPFLLHEDLQMLELFSGEQELTRQCRHLATQALIDTPSSQTTACLWCFLWRMRLHTAWDDKCCYQPRGNSWTFLYEMVLLNLHQLRIEWHRVSCNGHQERQGFAWLDIFPGVLRRIAPVASGETQWNGMERQSLW